MEFNIGKYSKFIVAVGGFVAICVQVAADGIIVSDEVGVVVTAAVTAAGVFFKRNTPPA
jgi:hypothetical protein